MGHAWERGHSEVLGVMHGSLIYDGDILGLRSVLHKFAPKVEMARLGCLSLCSQHLRINQIMTGLTEDAGHTSLSLNIRSWFSEQKLFLWGRSARLSGQRNL